MGEGGEGGRMKRGMQLRPLGDGGGGKGWGGGAAAATQVTAHPLGEGG